mgnify:FL=1
MEVSKFLPKNFKKMRSMRFVARWMILMTILIIKIDRVTTTSEENVLPLKAEYQYETRALRTPSGAIHAFEAARIRVARTDRKRMSVRNHEHMETRDVGGLMRLICETKLIETYDDDVFEDNVLPRHAIVLDPSLSYEKYPFVYLFSDTMVVNESEISFLVPLSYKENPGPYEKDLRSHVSVFMEREEFERCRIRVLSPEIQTRKNVSLTIEDIDETLSIPISFHHRHTEASSSPSTKHIRELGRMLESEWEASCRNDEDEKHGEIYKKHEAHFSFLLETYTKLRDDNNDEEEPSLTHTEPMSHGEPRRFMPDLAHRPDEATSHEVIDRFELLPQLPDAILLCRPCASVTNLKFILKSEGLDLCPLLRPGDVLIVGHDTVRGYLTPTLVSPQISNTGMLRSNTGTRDGIENWSRWKMSSI